MPQSAVITVSQNVPSLPPVSVLDRPLGAFEHAMILTQEYSPFNVVVALRLENAPPAAAIRRALDALQRRQPAMRCAVARHRSRRRFTPCANSVVLVVEESASADWLAAVDEELARVLPLAAGPLVHARYRVGPGAQADLFLTFAHAVIDAASGVYLVDQLLRLAAGEVLDDTEPLAPLPRLEQHFPAAFRGWRGRLRAGAALTGSLLSELLFQVRTRGARLPGIDPLARARAFTFELDATATAALLRDARRAGVTLNSALCAAFLLAARRRLRGGRSVPARLFTMADLRSYVSPPLDGRALGAGWAMMRFVVDPVGSAEPADFWQFARTLNARLHRELRHGAKYLAYLTILPMMRIGLGGRRFRMGEMAVSHAGSVAIASRYGAIEVRDLQVFVSNVDLGPEYIVQSRLRAGKLSWGIVYLDTDMDGDLARAVAAEAAALLGQTSSPAPEERVS